MRFVNCARRESEHNLAAFQSEGKIFYRTIENVCPGSELLVWYTYQYAGELEMSVDTEKQNLQRGATKKKFVHSQEHSGEKLFKCKHCGKAFRLNWILKRHLRLHTGEKPYKCGICGKGFVQGGNLSYHLQTHSGEKSKCGICGKGFVHSASLGYHLKVHSGEKPFKCEHCSMCFILRADLTNHLRTHSGEKPYKCEHCDNCFASNSGLHHHLKRKHSGVVKPDN